MSSFEKTLAWAKGYRESHFIHRLALLYEEYKQRMDAGTPDARQKLHHITTLLDRAYVLSPAVSPARETLKQWEKVQSDIKNVLGRGSGP